MVEKKYLKSYWRIDIMLNFKLKTNAIDSSTNTPLEDYLHTLGITATDQFIGTPSKVFELDGRCLDNALRMVDILHDCFEANKKFFLVVDCDTDGFTSSAIFYNYFKSIYPHSTIDWMLHEEKQHGIELDKIPADAEVIIVPDAGSNQVKEVSELLSQGKIVLIMDHHQVEGVMPVHPGVCLVNNQVSDNFYNKALSGAGVVFKIVQLYDKTYRDSMVASTALYDLAALGIIADCMDSRTLDNNYIIRRGLREIINPMFKALLNKQNYSVSSTEQPTKMDISFYIAPLINGTIRMGTMEDKELLFRGFIELNHTEYYEHSWRGSTNMESFYARSARIAFNVKNEQNRMKLKCLEFLQKRVEEQKLNDNKIIAVITYDDDEVPVPKTITGLVAMELLKTYGKPALVLRPTIGADGILAYAGSGRSNSYEELPSFLAFVRDQEESVYAQGHSCAFGASIKADEFDNFIEACNSKMEHIDFANDTNYVDVHFKNFINRRVIDEFARGAHIYGNQIPEPIIAIEATISRSDIRIMGKEASSISVTIGNIPCVKFKDAKLAEKLRDVNRAKVTIIGKAALNNYNGAVSSQLKIIDMDVEKISGGGLF